MMSYNIQSKVFFFFFEEILEWRYLSLFPNPTGVGGIAFGNKIKKRGREKSLVFLSALFAS